MDREWKLRTWLTHLTGMVFSMMLGYKPEETTRSCKKRDRHDQFSRLIYVQSPLFITTVLYYFIQLLHFILQITTVFTSVINIINN